MKTGACFQPQIGLSTGGKRVGSGWEDGERWDKGALWISTCAALRILSLLGELQRNATSFAHFPSPCHVVLYAGNGDSQ